MKITNYLASILTMCVLILCVSVNANAKDNESDYPVQKAVVELVSAQIYEVEQDMQGHDVRVLYDRPQEEKYSTIHVKISKEEGLKRANAIMKNATFGSGYVFDDTKGGAYAFALTDDEKIAAMTPDGLRKALIFI